MEFKDITTIDGIRKFVSNGIATAEFFKKDGSYRKMNFRFGVSKYVKGTDPVTTAKRAETNAERLQLGVYEMRGTSDRIEAENYRTLTVDPDRFIALSANGIRLVNPRLADIVTPTDAQLIVADFDLGEDHPLAVVASVAK